MLLLIYDKEDAATAKVNVFRQILRKRDALSDNREATARGGKAKGMPADIP